MTPKIDPGTAIAASIARDVRSRNTGADSFLSSRSMAPPSGKSPAPHASGLTWRARLCAWDSGRGAPGEGDRRSARPERRRSTLPHLTAGTGVPPLRFFVSAVVPPAACGCDGEPGGEIVPALARRIRGIDILSLAVPCRAAPAASSSLGNRNSMCEEKKLDYFHSWARREHVQLPALTGAVPRAGRGMNAPIIAGQRQQHS